MSRHALEFQVNFRRCEIKKFHKVVSLLISSCILLSLTACGTPQKKLVLPKAKDCFDISKTELESRVPLSAKVDCLADHNAETYLIGTWANSQEPWKMSDAELHDYVASVCQPWSLPKDTLMNYWAFYVPTVSDWKAGARWIRCDAMNQYKDQNGNVVFDSWKGLISVSDPSPKDGTPVTAGNSVYVYLEPDSNGCLGDGTLQEGDDINLVEYGTGLDPFTAPVLASGVMYSREGGCGLGASFDIRTSHHALIGTVVDATQNMIIGNIELTNGGNTTLNVSTN